MDTVLPTAAERARKMVTLVLQALSEPGRQVGIASAMGVSESTVSRLKNEHLPALCTLLAHAGLKIVPVESGSYAPEKVDALLLLAKAYLNTIQTADQLRDDGAA